MRTRTLEMMRDESGQMTIEFVVMFPVMLVIACIAANSLMFFSECAAFDVQAKNAVRTYATSPAYGENGQARTHLAKQHISQQLDGSFKKNGMTVRVDAEEGGKGMTTYRATLLYKPNLLGIALRDSLFGVTFPRLRHTVALTVSPYRPGMFV